MSEFGVFAVDRGIFDHPMLDDGEPFTKREAWLWLLAEAAWKPRAYNISGSVIQLQRGQLAHSVRFMATAWGWPKSNVARFLTRLKSGTMIGTADGTAATVITICKYDAYQRVSLPSGTANGTESGTELGQQRDRKEDIQDIQLNPLPPAGAEKPKRPKAQDGFGNELDPLFAEFKASVWAKRWKRTGHNPRDAFRAYSKLSSKEREACRACIERCARAMVSASSEEKYRPMLATWINKRGWEADSAGSAAAPVTDWPKWIAAFKSNGLWSPALGPRPDEDGCRAPAELLSEQAA